MKAAEMKQMEVKDLGTKVKALAEEVFRVRFQHATAQLQDASKLRKTRRELARAKTVLRCKELDRDGQPGSSRPLTGRDGQPDSAGK